MKGESMKTLFVCSDKKINNHVGEEYDSILEVQDQPTTETILDWANRIRGKIRALWMEQVQSKTPEPKVVCYLDGPTPYNAVMMNLQIIMKAEEGVVVELPYLSQINMQVTDPETLELLKKLDGKKQS
jgi:hypothetical protein